MFSPGENRIPLALLLGMSAAGANVVGGLLITRARSLKHYLKYFIALGAGFMLATARIPFFCLSWPGICSFIFSSTP